MEKREETQEMHGAGRLLWTEVNGISMAPTLLPGERVLVDTAVAPSQLRAGEVVAFRCGDGRALIHRFLERRPEGMILTRGDNNFRDDALWQEKGLIGRLAAVEIAHGRWAGIRAGGGRLTRVLKRLTRRDLGRLTPVLRPLLIVDRKGTSPAPARWESQELEDELLLYNPDSGDVHVLNFVAAEIWKWTRREQDERMLVETFPGVPRDQLMSDLTDTLRDFRRLGLIG
jgi:hypothetical protein